MELDRFRGTPKAPLDRLFILLLILWFPPFALAEQSPSHSLVIFDTELSDPQDDPLFIDRDHTSLTVQLPGQFTSYVYTVWNGAHRIDGLEQPLMDAKELVLDLGAALRQEDRFSRQHLRLLLTLRGDGEPLELIQDFIYYFVTTSTLPIVAIDAPPPVDRERIPADFAFYEEPGHDGLYHLTGNPSLSVSGTIHARGQSSLNFPKKSFALNFGKDHPHSILGMPESHKWTMIGGYVDTTHIANKVSYDLYAEMGHYGPQSEFVQVYFQGTYWGLYTFGEKIQRGKNHVDTPKKSKGGFIVKEVDSDPAFTTCSGRTFDYEYPDREDVTPEMAAHIQGTLNDFERKVVEGADWQADLNEEAEIDYFLITDAFANPDSYYKDKNLFYFLNQDDQLEPVIWDFIWAFGAPYWRSQNVNPWPCIYGSSAKCNQCQPSSCTSAQGESGDNQLMYGNLVNCGNYNCRYNGFPLMPYYLANAQNVEMYRERYRNWREGTNGFEPLLSEESLTARIDNLLAPLYKGDIYALDYERWQYSRYQPRYCAPDVEFDYCCTSDFNKNNIACEVPADMTQKLLDRLDVMDGEVPRLAVVPVTSGQGLCGVPRD